MNTKQREVSEELVTFCCINVVKVKPFSMFCSGHLTTEKLSLTVGMESVEVLND